MPMQMISRMLSDTRCGWARRLALPAMLTFSTLAQAHLMVDKRGTLNLVGDGAFLVVSLPVSALVAVDDNGDGFLDQAELHRHHARIAAQIGQRLQLHDADGPRPLEGLLLGLSPLHEGRSDVARHIVAMGRFALARPDAPHRLQVNLWGRTPQEQALQITVSRGSQAHQLALTPQAGIQPIFPTAMQQLLAWVRNLAQRKIDDRPHLAAATGDFHGQR